MRLRIPFTVPAALVFILMAHGAQSHRIGPADIYPDPAITPGAANPEVTQGNIRDNICNRQWSTRQIRLRHRE
jgi:hypothetical protein